MSLDQPAFSNALWDLYKRGGPRPEFLIPVLSYESGLNPAADNGVGYYGIGQNQASFIQANAGVDPQTYKSYSASEQLSRVVTPYFLGVVSRYGPLTSGVQVYMAEFYPASLTYAKGLDDVIVSTSHDDAAYEANKVFDTAGKGSITPRDLAAAITGQLVHANVANAITDAYANAPFGVGGQQDPVYGTGNSNALGSGLFATKTGKVIAVALAAGGLAYLYETGDLGRLADRARAGFRRVSRA